MYNASMTHKQDGSESVSSGGHKQRHLEFSLLLGGFGI